MFALPAHVRAHDHDGDDDDARPVHHHHHHDRDFDRDSERGAWHHDNGLHRGWYKHHHRDADDEDDEDDDGGQGGGYVAPSTYGQRYRRGSEMSGYPYLCDEDRDQCVPNPDFHGAVPALPAALPPPPPALPQPAANSLISQSLLNRQKNLITQEQQARYRYNQAVKNHNRKAAIYWLTRIQKLDAQIGALDKMTPAASTPLGSTSSVGSAVNTLAPVVQQMMNH